MENPHQLADRFREVLLDGTWIANTNFRDQLSTTSWQEAIQQVGTLNTIAALTFHVNYYVAGILHVFEGGGLEIRDKYSFDCPGIRSEDDWENLVQDLLAHAEKFADQVARMSAEKLGSVFIDEKYGTYRRNIEGMIEHSYYHLGQISLLKKMIRASQQA